MKRIHFVLIFLAFGLTAFTARAQSTGGGGGGDRPTMAAWNQGPVQVDPSRSTCRQLQETLQVFGKIRVNGRSTKSSIYTLTATRSLVQCTDPRQVSPFRVPTTDRPSCSLGYTCKDITFSH